MKEKVITSQKTELKGSFIKNFLYLRNQVFKETQKGFAQLLGITLSLLKDWESGKSIPNFGHLQKMYMMRININFLFDLQDNILLPSDIYNLTKKGHRISYYRREKGLTESDLKYLTGIEVSEITRIELLQKEPTDEQVQKISKILNIPFLYLKNGGEQPSSFTSLIEKKNLLIQALKQEVAELGKNLLNRKMRIAIQKHLEEIQSQETEKQEATTEAVIKSNY